MTTELTRQKTALRKQIRGALQKIPPAARAIRSAQIRDRLREQAIWRDARSILFFAPLAEEVDLWPLLEEALTAGKVAALPRFDPAGQSYVAARVQNLNNDIVSGQFGVREPAARCPEIPLHRLDLILVPGVAFDWRGCRLGRGRGFYDRLLAEVRGMKCGIAFDEQVVDAVPAGPSDMRVDFMVTPSRGAEIAG
jgi:5-formyltetrahydrofolate cyclo-ligase